MNGVTFDPGASVPTEQIEQRRVRQMYESRVLNFKDEFNPLGNPSQLVLDTKQKDSISPLLMATVIKPSPAASEDAPRAVRAVHKGFGRYILSRDDGTELEGGPYTKEQAEKLAAR